MEYKALISFDCYVAKQGDVFFTIPMLANGDMSPEEPTLVEDPVDNFIDACKEIFK